MGAGSLMVRSQDVTWACRVGLEDVPFFVEVRGGDPGVMQRV
jgi:hypothetical protein